MKIYFKILLLQLNAAALDICQWKLYENIKTEKNPYKLKISYQLIHLHAKYSRATDTKTAAIAALSAVLDGVVLLV